MTDEKMITIMCEAIDKYGHENQMLQCVEEMAELTQAVSKLRRATTKPEHERCVDNMVEEVADVYVMLSQMMIIMSTIYDKGEQLDEMLKYKINRLKERIDNEQCSSDRKTN
jgi:NTP pyrophosphatase (non-canonical NTP hydrolase)